MSEETKEQKEARLRLEKRCGELGRSLARHLPQGVGFTLLLFDFGEGGSLAYMSNAERRNMIAAMRELVRMVEVS